MKKILLAGAASIAFASAASAATISNSETFAGVTPAAPLSVFLDGFDSSLGTLQKVTVTLEGTVMGTWTFSNFAIVAGLPGATAGTGTATALGPDEGDGPTFVQVGITASGPDVVLAEGNTGSFTNVGMPGVVELTSTGPLVFFSDTIDGDVDDMAMPGDFTPYLDTGVDSIEFVITANALSTAATTNGFSAGVSGTVAEGEVTVTYEFDRDDAPVIPVPAALPLMAAGLGMLAWRARKA